MGCGYDRLVPAPSTLPLRVRPKTPPALRPMPLLRLPEPFDHPDWLFEVKHDGFRALAHVDGHRCDLVSRNGHTFKHWPQLCEELAHAVKAHDAVIDGEIVCLDARGRSNFKSLLFRRECDLEGIVGKLATGRYHADGTSTNWAEDQEPSYTQMTARHELFDPRQDSRKHRPILRV
jgi:ATP-dependent DNA ligase